MQKHPQAPDRLSSYFRAQWLPLLVVTLTGIFYNTGMTAGPWFECQLAQRLCDIIGGSREAADMLPLAASYVGVIALVQVLRYAKRFYVRRFANNVSRSMKGVLYKNLVHQDAVQAEGETTGSLMTKAIADVDTCAEGMRKFTTELFDTGVVLVAYLTMLFVYDWRLALLSGIFLPFAYLLADGLKKTVARSAAQYKEAAARLNGATLDRVEGALTYRVLGGEALRDAAYEEELRLYEKRAVRAGILETALQPLYGAVSVGGVLFIVWFGARNVSGTGWTSWDIAAFTTFLSCFLKLAVKSSKAAKLFNAVQKAKVSWGRIRPLLQAIPPDAPVVPQAPAALTVEKLSFSYPDGKKILDHISFTAAPGQIIGITGAVACGKSTLGRVFLCEQPYEGSIRFGDRELAAFSPAERCGVLVWQGHDPALLSDTVEENVLLGEAGDCLPFLRAVCLDGEVAAMPDGVQTVVGSAGVRLSGGQQARLSLARTLCRKRPLLVLDDPFAALDCPTEAQVLQNLRAMTKDGIVLLISHRLYHFPLFDKVLWMEDGSLQESTHEALLAGNAAYRALYEAQTEGEEPNA